MEEVRTARWGGAQAGRRPAGSVKTSLGHRGLEPKPFCRVLPGWNLEAQGRWPRCDSRQAQGRSLGWGAC